MELSDLYVFRTVVQAGGITRAAEKLGRVQSNVTTRIRQLEEHLGVQLFIRERKRLHLSPAGKVLLDYAERLLDLAREAQESVHDAKPRGLFRLGAMESTASVRLPAPLSEYCRRYPEVRLELRTDDRDQLMNEVLTGELDAALVAEPVPDAPFEQLAIYDEELVIVAAAGHPRLRSAREATTRTMLVFNAGCPYRKRLEDWFARAGEMPERLIEMSSHHAMLGCAVIGMGISALPRIVLDTFPERRRLSIHKLPPDLSRVKTLLIWRKGAHSPKLTALIEILKPAALPGRRTGGASGPRAARSP